MAGMIESTAPTGKITPKMIEDKLHLTPQQKPQLQRIVLAGMRVLFSPQTHKLMLKELDGPGTISQKLGQGIAGLMSLLFQESHRSIPPNLLIPAGCVLLAHAADFLRKAGQQVTDQDIASGIETMTTMLMHATGVDPDKVAEIGASGKLPPGRAQPSAQAAPPEPAAAPPQGMLQ